MTLNKIKKFNTTMKYIFLILVVVLSACSSKIPESPEELTNLARDYELGINTKNYELGIDTKDDNEKAFFLYQKAANQGYAKAQASLGSMYYYGVGTKQDYKQAFFWYQKAANQGYDRAQLLLGEMYYDGKGADQNYKEALYWFQKSAYQGNNTAQENLGKMYLYGKGVKQNYDKGLSLIKKSADNGGRFALVLLGEIYEHGIGVKQDYDQALYWYKKAVEETVDGAVEHVRLIEMNLNNKIKDIRITSSGKEFYILSDGELKNGKCKSGDIGCTMEYMLGDKPLSSYEKVSQSSATTPLDGGTNSSISKTNYYIGGKDTYVIATYFGGTMDIDMHHFQIIQIDEGGTMNYSEPFDARDGLIDNNITSKKNKPESVYSVNESKDVLTILGPNKDLSYTFSNGVLTTIDNQAAKSTKEIIDSVKQSDCLDTQNDVIDEGTHMCRHGLEYWCKLFNKLDNPAHDRNYQILKNSCTSNTIEN